MSGHPIPVQNRKKGHLHYYQREISRLYFGKSEKLEVRSYYSGGSIVAWAFLFSIAPIFRAPALCLSGLITAGVRVSNRKRFPPLHHAVTRLFQRLGRGLQRTDSGRASLAGMTGEKAQGGRGAGEMRRKGKATIEP